MKTQLHTLAFLLILSVQTLFADTLCRAPEALSVSSLTTSSATVSWSLDTAGDIPSAFSYTLKTSNGTTVAQNDSLLCPSMSYTFSNLTANTTYTLHLKGNCKNSYSGYSDAATITFTTLCTVQPAPYSEDFNSLTSLPPCTFSSNASLTPNGRTGRCIELNTDAGSSTYILFPELTLNSDTAEISLFLKVNSIAAANSTFQIGLCTDPSDVGSSFEPLFTDTLTNIQWNEIRMNTSLTSQPVTPTTMIAVLFPLVDDLTYYLDDVSIHAIPTCVRPEQFSLIDITTTTATLSWSQSSATTNRIYAYTSTTTQTFTVGSSPATLSGLTPNTDYTFQIRALCSTSDSSEINPYPLSAHTLCTVADSATFSEGFESLLSANTAPECWTMGWTQKSSGNTKTAPFSVSTARAHTGTRSMTLMDQPVGNYSYLASRQLPISQAGLYTLSVWIYREEASTTPAEGLSFYISPDPDNLSNATLLGSVPRDYATTPAESQPDRWYNYEYVLNSTGNQYIVIEGTSQNGGATFFDDVEVKLTPTCFKVTDIRIDNISTSSADIVWTPGGSESQWIVRHTYGTDTLSTPLLHIDSLAEGTPYTISGTVTSLCSASDSAAALPFSFTFSTDCSPLTSLPYVCGFEPSETSSATHPLPLCWKRLNDAPGVYDYYPLVNTSGDYSRSGVGCLEFQTSTWPNYGDNQIAILPAIDSSIYPVNSLRLSFNVSTDANNVGNQVIVGVMSDPDDFNSFSIVDSFSLTYNGYSRHVTSFSNYSGNGSYIALRVHRLATTSLHIWIDDITIAQASSCSDLDADRVTLSEVMDTSVRITINDPAVTSWSFCYGLSGTPATACTPIDMLSSTTLISGLSPYTDYVLYVRRKCGTDYGLWSDGILFTTACAAASLPLSDDFESTALGDLAGCYTVTGNDNLTSLAVISGSDYNHTSNGSKGLCTNSAIGATSTTGDYTVALLSHLEAGKTYEISIYAKARASNGILDWNLSFVYGSNFGGLNTLKTYNIATTSFNGYTAYLTLSTTGDYYVGVHTAKGNCNRGYYPYMDDIQIREVSCVPPLSSQVNALSSDSALICFSSNATLWEVAVSASPIDIDAVIPSEILHDTLSTNCFVARSLSPNTLYYYTIRSLCSGSESVWMQPSSFRTLCGAKSLPYSEGFESISSTYCWSQIGSSGSLSRSTAQHYSDSASLKITDTSVSTPELNVTTLAPYMITGWAMAASSNVSFDVQLSYDITDVSAASSPVATVSLPLSNTWHEFSVDFQTFLSDPDNSDYRNARYIILTPSQGTLFIDDILICLPPTCPKPYAASVSNVTAHQVTLDWSDSSSTSQWLVRAVPDTGALLIQSASSHPYTLSGLQSAMSYTISVAALCPSGDTSFWTRVGTVTTACDYISAPYFEPFDAMTPNTTPLCWDISSSTTSSLSSYPEYVWGVSNGMITMLNAYVAPGSALINSPEIILAPNRRYRLSYDYCNQANCGDLDVLIKSHSDSLFTPLDSHASNGYLDAVSPSRMLSNELSINAYAGDTIQIQFAAVANYSRGALWVDNLRIREVSAAEDSCLAPLVTVSVSPDLSANVIVQVPDGSPSGSYRWALSTSTNITDTIMSGVVQTEHAPSLTDTFTIYNLNASSSYCLFARTECTSTDHSAWTSVTFTTPCGVVTTFPYTEDFEDTLFPPRCWTNISLSTGTGWQGAIPGSWTRSTYVMSRFGNGTGWASLQGSAGASALLVSPALYFQPGREHHVSFALYRSRNSIFGTNILDQLKIYVGNSASTSGALLLADYVVGDDNVTTGVCTYDIDIPATVTGNCYVMFEGIFVNYGAVRLDDITIDIYPRCRDLTSAPKVVGTTATTATVSATMTLNNTAVQFGVAPYSATATPSDIIVVQTEHAPSLQGSSSVLQTTFSNLTPGTNYSLFARGICSGGDTTAWTSATTLSTKASNCYAPDGLTVTALSDTSVTIVWNSVPDASTYQCIITGAATPDTTLVTTASFTATNLSPYTTYTFMVSCNCSASSTSFSAVRFKTTSHPASLPYSTGFEPSDDNANWVALRSSQLNNFTIGRDAACHVSQGSHALYISDDDSLYHQTPPAVSGTTFSDIYGVTYFTHNIRFDSAADYEVQFDWRCDPVAANSSSYDAYGRAFLAPLSASLPVDSKQYMTLLPTGSIALGSDLTGDSLWTRSANIVSISAPCNMNLVFMWYSVSKFNSATADDATPYPLAIDNLSISPVTCHPVSSLSILSVGDTLASVQVTRTEGASLEYALLTVNNPDSISQTSETSSSLPTSKMSSLLLTSKMSSSTSSASSSSLRDSISGARAPQLGSLMTAATVTPRPQTPRLASLAGVATPESLLDTLHLTGLSPLTTYYLFVRTRCDSLNASSWRSITIRTTSTPAPLPYISGFEDATENSNWLYVQNQTNQFVISNATYSGGANSLYISDDASSYNYDLHSTSYAYAYRTFNLPAGFYEYSFDWQAYGENNSDFGRVFLLPAATQITPGAYIAGLDKTSVPTGAVALDGGSKLNLVSSYNTVADTFSLNAPGYYNLVIFWRNDASSGLQYPLSVDNISLRPSTCLFPLGTVTSIGDSTATALITNRSDSSALIYAVSPTLYFEDAILSDTLLTSKMSPSLSTSKMSPSASSASLRDSISGARAPQLGSLMTAATVTSRPQTPRLASLAGVATPVSLLDTISLTGLSPATDYYLMLRSLCDSTDISIWHRIPFRTHCSNDTSLVTADPFTDTICHNTPYTLHGFNVPASQLSDGWNSLSRLQTSSATCVSDTLYSADVFMRSDISTTTYDTICAGSPYNRGRWNIANPTSRLYFSTFTASCGCDSTVNLYLHVIPTSHHEYDTICLGDSYLFGDTTLTTPGVYARAYTTQYGCPDTTHLHLFVADSAASLNATICRGDSYLFEGQRYSQPGSYRVTVTGVHGCPLAKTLNLTVLPTDSTLTVSFCLGGSIQVIDTVLTSPGYYEITRLNTHGCNVTYRITASVTSPVPQQVYDFACQGYPYSGYGVSGVTVTRDTLIIVTTRTIDGSCDSLAHINLTYVPTLYGDTFAAVNAGETFTWYNQTYNQTGDYTETLTSVTTGCDSIVTLHLHVRGTGIDDVNATDVETHCRASQLTILPNPAPTSSTATLYLVTLETLGTLETLETLEIFSSTGTLLSRLTPDTYPIPLPVPPTAGLYYVRLTLRDGTTYTTKLIVH